VQYNEKAGAAKRRLIRLIYAGWLPQDLDPSGAASVLGREFRRQALSTEQLTRILLTVAAPAISLFKQAKSETII
jgi:hypothetical protein